MRQCARSKVDAKPEGLSPTARWHYRTREGVGLACSDYGDAGPAVILLHGLCGHAGEWAETASWLSKSYRVVAPEQRGHGRSNRNPADISRTAFVDDAVMWVEQLGLAPTVLVGHSLGGHTAFLLAARRPDLVSGLVVAEATPKADPEAPARVRAWLEAWPVPFTSYEQAIKFFGGNTLKAQVWASGLEQRNDGFWPRFEVSVMLAALNEIACRSYWDEWARIRCPVLVVRARGAVPTGNTQRMVELVPNVKLVEIEKSGHDLHLDQPLRWRETLEAFLSALDRRANKRVESV